MQLAATAIAIILAAILVVCCLRQYRNARWLRALQRSNQDNLLLLERYRSLFESSQDAVMTLEPPDWRFTSGNPAAVELFGVRDQTEFTRLRPWDLSPLTQRDGEPSIEKAKTMIETALRHGSQMFEWTHRRLSGEEFPAVVQLARVELGGDIFLQATVRDITAQKRAEQALREERERLNKLVAAAQDAIIMIDAEGKISMWNPAAHRIFGYSEKEAIGQNLHELLAPKRFLEAHVRGFNEFQRSGQGMAIGRVLEVVGLRKNGEEFPIELTVAAARVNGAWHAVGIIRDITQRKLIERQQEQYAVVLENQRQAMEQLYGAAEVANRAKTEFLANMSHEIRTPMTAILGYADLLADSLKNPEHLDTVRIIRRNGEHLLAIINDILDLSKIEAGRMQVERRPTAPLEIVEEIVSLFRVRAEGKGLKLHLVVDGPIPRTVHTDPTRLRQILWNLVGNAIKFTEVGEIRVTVRLIDRAPAGRQLRFEVTDTGIGMTPEQLGKLFALFQQADASTSRRFGGTGLGLAISKRLAQMLGGDITATSRIGEGSTFVLTIDPGELSFGEPSATCAPQSSVCSGIRESKAVLSTLNCHVLLAEDSPDNQRIISVLLAKAGAHVTIANNGQEAVEMVLARMQGTDNERTDNKRTASCAFAVILMDMQMPVMDGYEAVRQLRAHGYAGPIIALTAHAMADDRRKCLDAGCDDYATKPIDRGRLLQLVAAHAARNGAAAHPLSVPASRPAPENISAKT